MRAAALCCASLAATLLSVRGSPAQEPADVRLEAKAILDLARVDEVIASVSGSFVERVRAIAPELPAEDRRRLEAAIAKHFSSAALREGAEAYLLQEAQPGLTTQALAWLMEGAGAEVRRVREGFDPPLELAEFQELLRQRPAAAPRLELMRRWVVARSEVDARIILDDSQREAAYHVIGTLVDPAPTYEELTRDQYEGLYTRYMEGAVLESLYRLEPVADELLLRAVAEYESPVGQWYTEVSAFGVVAAVLRAAERTAGELRGEGGG